MSKLLEILIDRLTSPTRSILPEASPVTRGAPLPPELSTFARSSLLLLLLLALVVPAVRLVVVVVLAVLVLALPLLPVVLRLSPAGRDTASWCC